MAFFCFLLPLGLVDTAGVFTPVVVFLVSHAFFGLDVIGGEIEDLFGDCPHHLPLEAICRTIERQPEGHSSGAAPACPLTPVDNVLL